MSGAIFTLKNLPRSLTLSQSSFLEAALNVYIQGAGCCGVLKTKKSFSSRVCVRYRCRELVASVDGVFVSLINKKARFG